MKLSNNSDFTSLPGPAVTGKSAQQYEQHLSHQQHSRREQVETFISRRFLEIHGAHVTHFMPILLALFDANGEVLAAVGVRDAEEGSLFLEHYLDVPVERAIATHAGEIMLTPSRASIAEIGNLASKNRKASRRLFALLSVYLEHRDFDWAVFTGCSSLQGLFAKLGIKTVALGRALQSRLPADQQTWGGYYEDNPTVVAGKVSCGRDVFVNSNNNYIRGEVS